MRLVAAVLLSALAATHASEFRGCARDPAALAEAQVASQVAAPAPPAPGAKVSVTLYSESLCPFCQQFEEGTLSKVMESDLAAIIDLCVALKQPLQVGRRCRVPTPPPPLPPAATRSRTATPWCRAARSCASTAPRNAWATSVRPPARERAPRSTPHPPVAATCSRAVEDCVISLYPNQTQWFPTLQCIEKDIPSFHAQTCVEANGLDWATVNACAKGPSGVAAVKAAAAKTNALHPPHTYVPWVTVNGKALGQNMDALAKYVCDAYTGSPKPRSCGSHLQALRGAEE